MATTTIESAGVRLSVQTAGRPDGPVVILVHGFPDTHAVWNGVVDLLVRDHLVVTYDVRGAGDSSAPSARSGYRIARLVDDLVAVMDHVAPDGRPVHLVGHDWGSVQLWGAALRADTDPRLTGRIASFTSVSGPALELFGQFFRDGLRRRRFVTVGRQAARSWYVLAFQAPWLPELFFRHFGVKIRDGLARRQRLGNSHWGDGFSRDARHGINLYRANGPSSGRPTTSVPVQLVVPTKDAFLSPALYADVARVAPDLRRVDVIAGHWVVSVRPELIADLVRSFVADVNRRADPGRST